jgi:hypothetical protein
MLNSPADPVRLVCFGLDPSVPPARNDEYRELVARALAEPDFRERTEAAADALELDLLHLDAVVGVVLAARTGSVFTASWGWLRDQAKIQPTAENRMIVGMLLVGAAAVSYPSAAALSEPGMRRFTPGDIDALLRRHAQMIAEGETTLEHGLEAAWEAYTARKSVARTRGGKQLTKDCTVRLAEQVCELLAAQRLLLRSDEAGAVTYRSTDRFRHLVAHHGATLAYRTLIDSDAPKVVGAPSTEEQH